MLLNDPRTAGGITEDIGFFLDPNRYVRNQAEIIGTPQVAVAASEILGGSPTPAEVEASTSASAARDLDAVTILGVQDGPARAVALVDAVAQAYDETIRAGIQSQVDASIATLEAAKAETEARLANLDASVAADPDNSALEAQRNAAIAQLVSLDTRIERLSTSAALYGSGVQLYVAPRSATQTQPRPLRNAAIAAVLGLIGAGAWAWWRAERDQRADDRNTPARILDAPLLAVVPDYAEVGATEPVPTVTAANSVAAQSYHFVVSSLGFALDQVGGKSVVVTSTGPGDGKSISGLNIAVAASEDGRRTLLIDADTRVRGLTRIARFDGRPGLTDLPTNTVPSDLVHDWSLAEQTTVRFVPAGTNLQGDTAGYFRSLAFRDGLPKLVGDHDLVIIDTPPLMSAAETIDIAARADGVILVILPGTRLRHLTEARDRLALSGTPILGYIFNRAKVKKEGYGYGYQYGDIYGYGYGSDAGARG